MASDDFRAVCERVWLPRDREFPHSPSITTSLHSAQHSAALGRVSTHTGWVGGRMGGWVEGRVGGWINEDRWKDAWLDKKMAGWMKELMVGWMNERIDRQRGGWVYRWMDKKMDGKMDGEWMDERGMDE